MGQLFGQKESTPLEHDETSSEEKTEEKMDEENPF